MIETLSDTLDITEKIEIKNEKKQRKQEKAITKKIDKLIMKEFNKAKDILGHRLEIEKSNGNYYKFWFKTLQGYIGCNIYKHEIIKDFTWTVSQYSPNVCDAYRYFRHFKYSSQKIKTKEISKMIIEFVNTYFKEINNDD